MLRPSIFLACLLAGEPAAQSRPAAWQLVWSGEPLEGGIDSYSVSADGRRAATRGDDGRVIVWDLATLAPVLTLEGAGADGALMAFSPDGELLATQVPHWRPPPGLRVFRLRDGSELTGWKNVPLGKGSARADGDGHSWREGPELWVHPDGPTVFHPSDCQRLVVASTRTLSAGPPAPGQRFCLHAAGDRVALFAVEGLQGGDVPDGKQRNTLDVRVFKVPEGDEVDRFVWRQDQGRDQLHPVDACTFDFQALALCIDGVVRVLEFPSGAELYRFGEGVTALVRDGARRVTGHRDGSVACWDGARLLWRAAALPEPVHWLEVRGDEVVAGARFRGVAALRGGKRWRFDEDAGEAHSSGVWTAVRDRDRIQAFRDASQRGEWRGRDRRDGSYYGAMDHRTVPVVIARDRLVFRGNGRLCVFDLALGKLLGPGRGHRSGVRAIEWPTPGPAPAPAEPQRLLVQDWHQSVELLASGKPLGAPHAGKAVHYAGSRVVVFAELTRSQALAGGDRGRRYVRAARRDAGGGAACRGSAGAPGASARRVRIRPACAEPRWAPAGQRRFVRPRSAAPDRVPGGRRQETVRATTRGSWRGPAPVLRRWPLAGGASRFRQRAARVAGRPGCARVPDMESFATHRRYGRLYCWRLLAQARKPRTS